MERGDGEARCPTGNKKKEFVINGSRNDRKDSVGEKGTEPRMQGGGRTVIVLGKKGGAAPFDERVNWTVQNQGPFWVPEMRDAEKMSSGSKSEPDERVRKRGIGQDGREP